MGIAKLFQELTRKGLNPAPVDVKEIAQQPGAHFDLDLLGSFFSLIHNVMSRKYVPVRPRPPPLPPRPVVPRPSLLALVPITTPPPPAQPRLPVQQSRLPVQQPRPSAEKCAYVIAGVIHNIFGTTQNVVIHIDGARCVEKQKANNKRDQERSSRRWTKSPPKASSPHSQPFPRSSEISGDFSGSTRMTSDV